MNLDDLKIQLNKKLESNQSFEMMVAEANSFQNTKTNSIADKIKRSLITEIVFGLIFIIVFVYIVFFTKYNSIKIYFSVFSIVLISFIFILLFLLKRTQQLTVSFSLPVIENLKALHQLLSEFVKRYFQFTMLLIPICLIFSAYLGYSDAKNNIQSFSILPHFVDTKRELAFLFVLVTIFFITMYYFTKWYLKKLYGNPLEQLKEMIHQLES